MLSYTPRSWTGSSIAVQSGMCSMVLPRNTRDGKLAAGSIGTYSGFGGRPTA